MRNNTQFLLINLMSYRFFFGFFSAFLFSSSMSSANDLIKKVKDLTNIEVKSQVIYDSSTGKDFRSSSILATLGDDLTHFLDEKSRSGEIDYSKHKVIQFRLAVQFSNIPSLIKDKTFNDLMKITEERISEAHPSEIADVIADQYGEWTKPIAGVALRSHLARPFVESLMLSQAARKYDTRLEKLKFETSLQVVDFTFVIPLKSTHSASEAQLFIIPRFGKAQFSNSQATDARGDTHLSNILLLPSLVESATSVASTTGLGASLMHVLEENKGVNQYSVFIVHGRPAFRSAQQYISQIIQLSDEQWEHHNKLDELDTVLMRALFQRWNQKHFEKTNIYISGLVSEDAYALSTGVTLDLTPKRRIHLGYAYSTREEQVGKNRRAHILHAYYEQDISLWNKEMTLIAGAEYSSSDASQIDSAHPKEKLEILSGLQMNNPVPYLKKKNIEHYFGIIGTVVFYNEHRRRNAEDGVSAQVRVGGGLQWGGKRRLSPEVEEFWEQEKTRVNTQ